MKNVKTHIAACDDSLRIPGKFYNDQITVARTVVNKPAKDCAAEIKTFSRKHPRLRISVVEERPYKG